MKVIDKLESIPLSVYAFGLAVVGVAASGTLNLPAVLLLLGILSLHYVFKFIEIKEKNNKILSEMHLYLKQLEDELRSQRTDISKLNLLFGINQNMTKGPANAFMAPGLRELAESEMASPQSAWTPKKTH